MVNALSNFEEHAGAYATYEEKAWRGDAPASGAPGNWKTVEDCDVAAAEVKTAVDSLWDVLKTIQSGRNQHGEIANK